MSCLDFVNTQASGMSVLFFYHQIVAVGARAASDNGIWWPLELRAKGPCLKDCSKKSQNPNSLILDPP